MNIQEKKDLYAAATTAAELVLQRIENKSKNKSNEEILRSPKLFADNTLKASYKVSKKWNSVALKLKLKNYQKVIYEGKYLIADPNVSTKDILNEIWRDAMNSLYIYYGVSY